jgi:hypothetical protein
MIIEFTDNDYAVMLDCMGITREGIRKQGMPTPNIDAAMEKMCKWGGPAGCEFLVVTGEDAELIRNVTEPIRPSDEDRITNRMDADARRSA